MPVFMPLGTFLASSLALAVLRRFSIPAVTSLLRLAVIPLGLSTPLPELLLVTASLSKLERAADAPLLLFGAEPFWVNPTGGCSLLDRELI